MRNLHIALICLLFMGCTTAYGPANFTGGYKERKLDENSYIVSFFGNGNTSEQQVWNYWIYRCAELTLQNGYELFALIPSDKHALLNDPDKDKLVEFAMYDDQLTDGHPSKVTPVQYYYYSVTTYSSKAIVNMYKVPVPAEVSMDILLDAKTIIEVLKPYVDSKAKIVSPDRKNLFIRAAVEAVIRAKMMEGEEADTLRNKTVEI